MKSDIIIYTDGASRGNPGPGGWAAIILTDKNAIELAGAQKPATNNQMELMAVAEALQYVMDESAGTVPEVALHTDSTYVLKGLESWLDGWQRNGWMTKAKTPVENRAIWERLYDLRQAFGRKLTLVKVAGHSGHAYNDRCDEMAVAAALGNDTNLFEGARSEYETRLLETPPKSPPKKATSKSNKGEAYSYVSLVGGKVHVDSTWAACEKRVKGTKGAKYKKALSKADETSLIQDYTLSSLLG